MTEGTGKEILVMGMNKLFWKIPPVFNYAGEKCPACGRPKGHDANDSAKWWISELADIGIEGISGMPWTSDSRSCRDDAIPG